MHSEHSKQPSVIEVYQETVSGLDIRAAFMRAQQIERFANLKDLTVGQTQSLVNEIDSSELWSAYYLKPVSVTGWMHKTKLVEIGENRRATQIEIDRVFCDDDMQSHGFYVTRDQMNIDDQPVAQSIRVGHYFIDVWGQHYFGDLSEIEVTPIDDRHLATERLRRYYPTDAAAIEAEIAQRPNEEGYVVDMMQTRVVSPEVHPELKQQYIADLEEFVNSKVVFDKEVPYRIKVSGASTRLHPDGQEVPVELDDYRAYIQPARIRLTAIPDDPERYRFELEYSECSSDSNGVPVCFRTAGNSIHSFQSLLRHAENDLANL